MSDDINKLVCDLVRERILEKGFPQTDLGSATVLLGGDLPIDSLDVATILIDLQEQTGRDPFADGFIEFRTIGELVSLYLE